MYEFRSLLWDELDKWFDHCAGVFSSSEGRSYDEMRRYFMNHWYNDSARKLDGIFVAVANGQIVSTVRVFHRYIYLNGRIVAMGGIGEVSTKPEHRRQGLSGRLLEMAIEYMTSCGMVISSLGTGVPQHYARYGWEPVARFVSQAEVGAKHDSAIRLLDWDDPKELHQVISCYDNYAVQFNGTLVRDEGYWQKWIRTEAGRAWVLREGGDVVAYLMAKRSSNPSELIVQDFGAKKNDADSFGRLVSHAVSSFGQEHMSVFFPAAIRSGLGGVQTHREDGKMIRLVGDSLADLVKQVSLEELVHQGSVTPESTRLLIPQIDGF